MFWGVFFGDGRLIRNKWEEEEERNGRGDWIRTSDPSVPNAVRYQLRHTPTFGLLILPAALCPVKRAANSVSRIFG